MNFVAHAHVALRCAEANWERAFGATLPDLASMADTRIDRSLLSRSVEDGVALHHRTDTAFHALEAFHTARVCSRLACPRGRLGPSATRATSFFSTAAS
jgi:hypothetical protein